MTATQVARRLGLPAILLIACALIPLSVESLHAQQSTIPPSARARAISTLQAQPLSFEPNRGQTLPQVRYLARTSSYDVSLLPDAAWFAVPGQNASAQFHMRMIGADPQANLVSSQPLPGVSNYFIGNDPAKWRAGIPQFAQVSYQNLYPGIGLTLQGSRRNLNLTFALQPGAANAVRLAFDGAVSTDAQGNLVVSSNNNHLILGRPAAYQYSNGVQSPVDVRYTIGADNQVSFLLGAYDHSRPLVIAPAVGNLVVANTPTAIAANHSSNWKFYLALVPVFGLALLSAGASSKSRRLMGLLLAALAFSGTGFLIACGGSGSGGGGNGGGPGGGGGGGGGGTSPILAYSTYWGNTGITKATGVAVDGSGNLYVTGETAGLPNTSGFPGTSVDTSFVTKFNSSGAVTYSTYVGGTIQDVGLGVAIDSSGNAYVVGNATSGDFPIVGGFQSSLGGQQDAFVYKLDPTGANLLYSTFIGGTGAGPVESGHGIAVDQNGVVYIVGETNSSDFPVKNAFQGTFQGQDDAFVAKIDATQTGSASLLYSTYIGGTGGDSGTSIGLDSSGNIYITGITLSTNFPTASPIQPQCGTDGTCNGGIDDSFVTEISSSGTSLVYSTYLGGSGTDDANAIAVDSTGAAYVTGSTSSTDFPTTAALQSTSGGGAHDAFITKIAAGGGSRSFSTYLGGNNDDIGFGIALDSSSDVYVTGSTSSSNFKTTAGAFTTLGGGTDAFVTELSSSGSSIVFSTYFGGTNNEDTLTGAIAIDSSKNIYFAGDTTSASGFTTLNPAQGSFAGTSDGFVAKITP